MIPTNVKLKLSAAVFKRGDTTKVVAAFDALPARVSAEFREFFRKFRGPFGSEMIGYQLLDLVEDEPSILTATAEIRKEFALPDRHLIISDLLANGILIYDCRSDVIFDVDFEDGYIEFIDGITSPRWATFDAFLQEFFACNDE